MNLNWNTFVCGYLTSVAVTLGIAITAHECKRSDPEITEQKTTVVTTDTIVKHIIKPVLKDSTVIRYATIKVPVKETVKEEIEDAQDSITVIGDSVTFELPITQKVYRDSTYQAWVSGYNPSLDSIRIYQPVTSITNTTVKTQTKYKTKHWGLGLQVGAGFNLTQKGTFKIEPYIGVGINYNIFSW